MKVYEKDFCNDADLLIEYFMQYLNDEDYNFFNDIDDGKLVVKYDPYPDRFYSSLRLWKM